MPIHWPLKNDGQSNAAAPSAPEAPAKKKAPAKKPSATVAGKRAKPK